MIWIFAEQIQIKSDLRSPGPVPFRVEKILLTSFFFPKERFYVNLLFVSGRERIEKR
jgi:hypothetical protein